MTNTPPMEMRWLERRVCDGYAVVRVLQYRNSKGTASDGEEMWTKWSDWQDVPVAKE